MDSEEGHCLRSMVTTLYGALRRYSAAPRPHTAGSDAFSAAVHGADALTAADCVEFTALAATVVESCSNDAAKVQALLFDAPFDLTALLANIAEAALPPSLLEWKITAVGALKRVALVACGSPTLRALFAPCAKACHASRGLTAVLRSLEAPAPLRTVCAEALFVMALRAQVPVLTPRDVGALLTVAATEQSADVRSYIAAVVRSAVERYSPFAAPLSEDDGEDDDTVQAMRASVSSATSMRSLATLLAMDDAGEVRALAASALDALLRWPQAPDPEVLQRISEATSTRLSATAGAVDGGGPEHSDEATALCRLVEVTASSAAAAGEEGPLRWLARTGAHKALLRCLLWPDHVAAAAAKALRMLVTCAPPSAPIAPALMDHHTVSLLCRVAVDVSPTTVAQQVLAVELALVLGAVMLFAPLHRSAVPAAIRGGTLDVGHVRQRLQSNLMAAAVDYFDDVVLFDATGVVLNDPQHPGLEWLGEANIAPDSVRLIVHTQLLRSASSLAPDPAQAAQWWAEAMRRPRTLQAGYLAFVLCGFAAHDSFTEHPTVPTGAPPKPHDAAPASAADAAPQYADPHRPLSSTLGSPEGLRLAEAYVTNYSPQHDTRPGSAKTPRQLRRATLSLPQETQPRRAAPAPVIRRSAVDTTLSAEFESCMKLVLAFAQHFDAEYGAKRGPSPSATRRAAFAPDESGFVRRTVGAKSRLNNPWRAPEVKRTVLNAWGAAAVSEGDLFFFAIPLAALTCTVVDSVVEKAKRHFKAVKKAYTVAPRTQSGRRHFLHDMMAAVMPNIVSLLARLHKTLQQQTESHVQLALGVLPDVARATTGEKRVDCGNLVVVTEYLAHYFANRPQHTADVAVDERPPVNVASPRDVEASEADLARMAASYLSKRGPANQLAELSPQSFASEGADA